MATGRPVELGEEGLFLGQVPILLWKVTALMLGLSERQGCSPWSIFKEGKWIFENIPVTFTIRHHRILNFTFVDGRFLRFRLGFVHISLEKLLVEHIAAGWVFASSRPSVKLVHEASGGRVLAVCTGRRSCNYCQCGLEGDPPKESSGVASMSTTSHYFSTFPDQHLLSTSI